MTYIQTRVQMEGRRERGRLYTLSAYQGRGRWGPSPSPYHPQGTPYHVWHSVRACTAPSTQFCLKIYGFNIFHMPGASEGAGETPSTTLGTNSDVFVLRYRMRIDRQSGSTCKKGVQHCHSDISRCSFQSTFLYATNVRHLVSPALGLCVFTSPISSISLF
jgi:hypothetical protein